MKISLVISDVNATDPGSISEHLTDETVISGLDELPDCYRSVIPLVHVYEFKYKEVAEILQIPIGTVMSRLNRARAILRNSLAKLAQETGIIQSPVSVYSKESVGYSARIRLFL